MSNYTKVNVRKDIYELLKIKAAADNRSLTNYVEQLLLADVSTPSKERPRLSGEESHE